MLATLGDTFFSVFPNGTRFFVGGFIKKHNALFCFLFAFLAFALIACNRNNVTKNNDDTNSVAYLPYEIDNTGCLKRFYANETNSVNIVIPSTYNIDENGKIIEGNAYQIKSIGAYCFANNNLVETVFIPDTIIKLDDFAFFNCPKLNTININSEIVSIGNDAFGLCPELTTVSRNANSGLMLAENNNLTTFIIPDSINKIEDKAFADWDKLTSIVIGENITYIGNEAFSHCNSLSLVNINSVLDYLGNGVFEDCQLLTTLTNTHEYNGEICFAPNQRIRNFTVPNSVKTIKNGFFYGWKNLIEVNIHKEITSLREIFSENENLKKLTCGSSDIVTLFRSYPNNTQKIENDKMYMINFTNSYGTYTYQYYIPNSLKEVHILNDVETHCLAGMKSVQIVYLPSEVTEFGKGAFAGCSGLTNVYFSTDNDWTYSMSSSYTFDRGTISKTDMNNSVRLAYQLKQHNGSEYVWKKS